MALSIKHPGADLLARELASLKDETITEAVLRALRERLEREKGRKRGRALSEEVARIQRCVARLRVRDDRSAEEILGYDDQGLPR